MEVTLREAEVGDAVALATLLGELGYPALPEQVTQRLVEMRAEAGQRTLVATVDDEVVGMATVIVRHVINNDAPIGRLASIVVAEGWRERGIGERLVREAERTCVAAGCHMIEVTSGEHRPRAHDFYRRLGYSERRVRFVKQL